VIATHPIYGFTGEHRFLSNFYPSVIVLDGIAYPAVEHAFQAQKTLDAGLRQRIADASPTTRDPVGAAAAKAMGRRVALRPDWEDVKDDAMLACLRAKFSPSCRSRENFPALLLATGDRELIEANTWNDRVWGVDRRTGVGQNRLGILLMRVRDELRGVSAP
jgi:ribA/ribD-fused uncharacterized protein